MPFPPSFLLTIETKHPTSQRQGNLHLHDFKMICIPLNWSLSCFAPPSTRKILFCSPSTPNGFVSTVPWGRGISRQHLNLASSCCKTGATKSDRVWTRWPDTITGNASFAETGSSPHFGYHRIFIHKVDWWLNFITQVADEQGLKCLSVMRKRDWNYFCRSTLVKKSCFGVREADRNSSGSTVLKFTPACISLASGRRVEASRSLPRCQISNRNIASSSDSPCFRQQFPVSPFS